MSVPANLYDTYDIVASPTDDTETVIAILNGVGELVPGLAVHLSALVGVTPETAVTGLTLIVRRNDLSGDTVGDPADVTFTATGGPFDAQVGIEVVDFPGDFAGAVYVLTLECVDAGDASTVTTLGFHARTS